MYRYVVEVKLKDLNWCDDRGTAEYSGIYHTSKNDAVEEARKAMEDPAVDISWICQKRVENWEVNR